MVGTGRQPARLHPVRYLRDRRPRRSLDRVDDRPGRCELDHGTRSGVLPGLRSVHTAHRLDVEVGALPQAAQAGVDRRARRRAGRLARAKVRQWLITPRPAPMWPALSDGTVALL